MPRGGGSTYRKEKQRDIPFSEEYPIILTTDEPWENETKGVTWWRWQASLPEGNPNKQGRFDQEWVYFDIGSPTLNGMLEHAVSEYSYQDDGRTKTAVLIVRGDEDEWDVKPLDEQPKRKKRRRKRGGGKSRKGGSGSGGNGAGASDGKAFVDGQVMAVTYFQKALADAGVEIDDKALVALANTAGIQASREGWDLSDDLRDFVDLPVLGRSNLSKVDDSEEEEDDLPF